MKIVGYLRTSLIEWPEKISSVIFVSGCNFRCPFCHNRELVLDSPWLPLISEKEIFSDLRERKRWIDGIVVTGGEPTLQKDLDKFLLQCKKMGLKTMIETNGSLPQVIAKLLNKKIIDRIVMDFKGPLDCYQQVVRSRINVSQIQDSLKMILNSKIDFELRTTVVPKIHQEKILTKMAKELKKIGKGKRIFWVLQNFQPKNCLDPEFEKVKPFAEIQLKKFLKKIKKIIPKTELS